uniref:Consortin, connexin sorting protein n=1 Tax=Leptobrachium leishanense TaxID=445787 RepID=A0A8C5MMX1_9ANUR
MNTKETPHDLLQTRSEVDFALIDELRVKEPSYLPTSDVNENKVDGEKGDTVIGNKTTRVNSDAQDTINNNENCNLMCGQVSCKNSCEDNDGSVTAALSVREMASCHGKRTAGRRNGKNRKNCNSKSTEFVPADMDSNASDPNTCLEQRNQKQLRDSLFLLIQDGFEQTDDARMLPTCLHQIAETYFQEEDYEMAIQFIQLEREYHEQLLANLSAIQEQWEAKQKTTDLTSLTSPRKSENNFSSTELKRLRTICVSHQHPKILRNRAFCSEQSTIIHRLKPLIVSPINHDVDGPADSPDRRSRSGSKPTKDGKPGLEAMTESSPPDTGAAAEVIKKAADHQAVPKLGHTEEHQSRSSGGTSKAHTQSTGAVGRANAVSSLSGDAVKKNKISQPEATPHCSNDASNIETFPEDPRGIQPGKPMVDKLISAGKAEADCVSAAQRDLPGESLSLECSGLDQKDKVGSYKEKPHTGGRGGTEEAPQKNFDSGTAEDIQEDLCKSSFATTDLQTCLEEGESEQQVTLEFSSGLLNGDLKESESFPGFQEADEDMSPSPGDAILGDSFLSLDELAKRIQVEELEIVQLVRVSHSTVTTFCFQLFFSHLTRLLPHQLSQCTLHTDCPESFNPLSDSGSARYTEQNSELSRRLRKKWN